MNIKELCNCPKCNAQWKGEDIYEKFKSLYKDKSEKEILDIASSYGWTKENKKCFSNLIGLQIQGVYDGVLYWKCPNCQTQWGRFSNEEIIEYDHKKEKTFIKL